MDVSVNAFLLKNKTLFLFSNDRFVALSDSIFTLHNNQLYHHAVAPLVATYQYPYVATTFNCTFGRFTRLHLPQPGIWRTVLASLFWRGLSWYKERPLMVLSHSEHRVANQLEKFLTKAEPASGSSLEACLTSIFGKTGLNFRLLIAKARNQLVLPKTLEFMLNFTYCTRNMRPEEVRPFIARLKSVHAMIKIDDLPLPQEKLSLKELARLTALVKLNIPEELGSCDLLRDLKQAQDLSRQILELLQLNFGAVKDGAFCLMDARRIYPLNQDILPFYMRPSFMRYFHCSLKTTIADRNDQMKIKPVEAHLVVGNQFIFDELMNKPKRLIAHRIYEIAFERLLTEQGREALRAEKFNDNMEMIQRVQKMFTLCLNMGCLHQQQLGTHLTGWWGQLNSLLFKKLPYRDPDQKVDLAKRQMMCSEVIAKIVIQAIKELNMAIDIMAHREMSVPLKPEEILEVEAAAAQRLAFTPFKYVNSPFAADVDLNKITPLDFSLNSNLVETQVHLGKLPLFVNMDEVT